MRTVCVILGGGRGSRLEPLTTRRAKPAVPLAGKYRLIDIPLSNCLNSGLKDIFVLTQFQSASLNTHVARTYRFDMFNSGRLEVLAAEQTGPDTDDWYQGTADAVRKQLRRVARSDVSEVMILSGDHLYRMDYRALLRTHRELRADVTVSTLPVNRADCDGFGVLSMNDQGLIRAFTEKPPADADLTDFLLPAARREGLGDRAYMASMGVYVFSRDALVEALSDPANLDFGGHILPKMIRTHRVAGHLFDGYWEDIGTISSFFEANLRLARHDSPFRFYEPSAPIYTRPRFLPPSIIRNTHLEQTLLSDGCLVDGASVINSVVGIRSRIQSGALLLDTVMMGADYYEDTRVQAENRARGDLDIGVGANCVIERAILDKNARIGADCVLRGAPDRPDEQGAGWRIRDGIIIVPKGAVIPAGTVI